MQTDVMELCSMVNFQLLHKIRLCIMIANVNAYFTQTRFKPEHYYMAASASNIRTRGGNRDEYDCTYRVHKLWEWPTCG